MEMKKSTIKRIIRLDGRRMTDRAATHSYLKDKFGFPDYYGNNLDALYDLLMENGMPLKIILTHADALKQQQEEYGEALLSVFEASDTANRYLEFEVL